MASVKSSTASSETKRKLKGLVLSTAISKSSERRLLTDQRTSTMRRKGEAAANHTSS